MVASLARKILRRLSRGASKVSPQLLSNERDSNRTPPITMPTVNAKVDYAIVPCPKSSELLAAQAAREATPTWD